MVVPFGHRFSSTSGSLLAEEEPEFKMSCCLHHVTPQHVFIPLLYTSSALADPAKCLSDRFFHVHKRI